MIKTYNYYYKDYYKDFTIYALRAYFPIKNIDKCL